MSKVTSRTAVVLVAAAIIVTGLFGAYSYGRDYWLHRGFAALVPLPRAGTGRLESVSFYSEALHRNAGYLAYLPPRLQLAPPLPGLLPPARDAGPAQGVRRHREHGRAARQPTEPRPGRADDPRLPRRADRRQRLLGLRVGRHPGGRLRELRDRGRARRRSPLRDDALPLRPGDRRLLGRRLRRDQHRAASPRRLRQRPDVVGLLHPDAHRRVRARQPRRPRLQQPDRLRRAARAALARDPLRVYMFIGRDDGRQRPAAVDGQCARARGARRSRLAIVPGRTRLVGLVPPPQPDARSGVADTRPTRCASARSVARPRPRTRPRAASRAAHVRSGAPAPSARAATAGVRCCSR